MLCYTAEVQYVLDLLAWGMVFIWNAFHPSFQSFESINGLNLLEVTLIGVHLATKQALTLTITQVSLKVSMF
jgi:hypothetical protein